VLTAFCQSLKIHDYSCNSPLVVPSLLLTVIDGLLLIDREYRRIKAKLVVKTLGTIGLISILSLSQRQYHAYLELDCLCIIAEESKGANSISN
jgi:hypothetical protein